MIKRNYSLKDFKMPLNGEAVRMLLKTRGETLTHACKQLGWSNSYLSHLTLGYTLVRRDNLLKLADYLCVMPTQIMKARLSKKDIKLLEKNRSEMKQAIAKQREQKIKDSGQLDLLKVPEEQSQPLDIVLSHEDQSHEDHQAPQKSNAIQEAKAELNKVDDHVDKVKAQLAEIYDSTAKIDALIDVANQKPAIIRVERINGLNDLNKVDTLVRANMFLRANNLLPIYETSLKAMLKTVVLQRDSNLKAVANGLPNEFLPRMYFLISVYSALASQLQKVIKRGNKND